MGILQRNSPVLNAELRTTKVNFHTEEQRNREIPKVVEDKSNQFDENRTVVQQEMNLSWHHNLSGFRIYFFCVSNSYLTVISERFSYHPDGKFRLSWDFLWSRRKMRSTRRVQSRFRGTRTMPYTPVSCGTGYSFRDTRTVPYTPVSCGTGHSFRDTRSMPYAYGGGECWRERAPAWRENAFWSRVMDCGRETEIVNNLSVNCCVFKRLEITRNR